ncbi:MAG: YggS family pyridoxal phosphate-dependent enzyme [Bacteroidales bacterium]|nr:YggS family pyridoxal phosphate-dependent enzyme [Bacteroidales bacterium]
MVDIKANIENIRKQIPDNVVLIAVSKTKPIEDLMQAYNCGQRIFGENKAQEMRDKHEVLPKDIQWHFIGHLQENKIKYIVDYVSLIHSVDSFKLLKEIDKQAKKRDRVVNCLFEMDISHEESKFGMSYEELNEILANEEFAMLENIRICGLMGIGSITEDREQTRKEFRELKKMFEDCKAKYFSDKEYFKHISMGMSGDYDIALQERTTFVRIGSGIFGERDYSKKI